MKRLVVAFPRALGRNASKAILQTDANTAKTLQTGRQFSVQSDKVPVSTTAFPEFDSSFKTHDELYRFSLNTPDFFWGTLARSRLDWFADFGQVKDCDLSRGHIRWFLDGKINVAGKLNVFS